MWSCVFLRMELAMVGSASEMAEVLWVICRLAIPQGSGYVEEVA